MNKINRDLYFLATWPSPKGNSQCGNWLPLEQMSERAKEKKDPRWRPQSFLQPNIRQDSLITFAVFCLLEASQ